MVSPTLPSGDLKRQQRDRHRPDAERIVGEALGVTGAPSAPDSGGVGPVVDEVPAPSNPMGCARELLLRYHLGEHPTLCHWRDEWRRWDGSSWPVVGNAEVSQAVYNRFEHAAYLHPATERKPAEHRPWRPNRTKVGDVLDAMAKIVLVPPATEAPTWLGGAPPRGYPANPSALIPVANGLLDVSGGRRTLHPHTPEVFNLHAAPFPYDPAAARPSAWLEFLHSLWPDDPTAIDTLAEWFGYVLSGRTDQQKILLTVGPKRSGKGTIARVLGALLGKGNHVSPTLASLGTNFGLQPLIGKPLAIVADARLSSKADVGAITERLLSVSGEDAQTIDRKHREAWTGPLNTRFMVLSNELPRLTDASGAIASRFVTLVLGRSFFGHEDTRLTTRLLAELPGILAWSLDGLDRLTTRGAFVEPDSSADAVQALNELTSPVLGFLRDRCERGGEVATGQLYAAWRQWAGENGYAVTSEATFGRDLRAAMTVQRAQRGTAGGKRWHYVGVRLAAAPVTGLRVVQSPAEFMASPALTSANGHYAAGWTPPGQPSG